jgi:hypothetical protein
MALSINQSNYATPVGSYDNLYSANVTVQPYRFLSLTDNVLDGSCHPLGPDYVWWGNSLSDADGLLAEPVEITIDGLDETLFSVSLIGDTEEDNYPVDYTISAYKDGALLVTDEVVGNTVAAVAHQMSEVHIVDTVIITISRISKANSVAKLTNAYHPFIIVRSDQLSLNVAEDGLKSDVIFFTGKDTAKVSASGTSHITNSMKRLYRLPVGLNTTTKPTNIHTVMKSPTREIFGKVEITYTDPLIEGRVSLTSSGTAYGSSLEQASDANTNTRHKYFSLYDNVLDGTYHCIGDTSNVGWWSNTLSDSNGNFSTPPTLSVSFRERPIFSITIIGDAMRNSYPVDFDIVIKSSTGSKTFTVRNNTEVERTVDIDGISAAIEITFVFRKVSRGNYPVTIIEVPMTSTVLYDGDKLMSINMLEELSYEDEQEALGGISANELTVVLSNADKSFYFNNNSSYISKYLKKNRKVRAWLGARIDGTIEWYTLGTYWSYRWDVPIGSLTAQVVAFDTIGLLNTMVFHNHMVFVNKSIGYLVDYILSDAKEQFDALEWYVEPELYDVTIPYCWFAYASHMAALKDLSLAYPLNIYCDRDGRVIAKTQRINLDYFYDTWSESDTVVETSYPTMYTALPNHIDVEVASVLFEDTQILNMTEAFTVVDSVEKTFTFSATYLSNLNILVDCDESLLYTYSVYSWGIVFNFYGTGEVRSITADGTTVKAEVTSMVTNRDINSIALNGTIKRTIQSNFIQSEERASYIANRITELSKQDKYDAEVTYRGDIALSIDNPVILADGIAPINKYNIVRHELHWDGGLRGTATLNT